MANLEKYINKIQRWEKDNLGVYPNTVEWSFYGDGQGDFEEISESVPNKILLLEYQLYLKEQFKYTRELLENYHE